MFLVLPISLVKENLEEDLKRGQLYVKDRNLS